MTVTAFPPADPGPALVAAIDALAAQEPADLPACSALERARLLLAQAERLRTLGLQAIADVDSRDLFAVEGAPTTAAWVDAQQVAGLDRREVALARRLRSVPVVEAELLAGRLSAASGAKVTAAVAKARPFLDRPDGLIDGQPGEPALTVCWSTVAVSCWPSRPAVRRQTTRSRRGCAPSSRWSLPRPGPNGRGSRPAWCCSRSVASPGC